MKGKRRELLMLYDDRADISIPQLERIVQSLVWLADGIILPAYARPNPLLNSEVDQRIITSRLGELAEAGYIQQWKLEPEVKQFTAATWWPGSTHTSYIDLDSYRHLQRSIRTGIELYRDDILRGVGRPARASVSGISEFVSLQDSLWTVGLARFLNANYLLSSDTRSLSLSAPLRRLATLGTISGPVSKTIMELHGIGPLHRLSVADIRSVRRFKPTARSLIADVVREVDDKTLISLDHSKYVEAALESAQRRYAELLGDALQSASKNSTINDAVGIGITIAGNIFPPLGTLSYAQPLMSWEPHGRSARRLVTFLTKLKKKVAKASRS